MLNFNCLAFIVMLRGKKDGRIVNLLNNIIAYQLLVITLHIHLQVVAKYSALSFINMLPQIRATRRLFIKCNLC